MSAPASGGYEVVARFDVGGAPGEIGIERPVEGPAWGPASFDVGKDGSIYVLDGVNSKVHVVDHTGANLQGIPFPEGIVCPTDIDVVDQDVYLLDLAAQPAAIERLSLAGELEDRWEIPLELSEDGVSGLNVEESPAMGARTIYLEFDNAWEAPFVVNGRVTRNRVPKVRQGEIVDIPAGQRSSYAMHSDNGHSSFAAVKDWDTWGSATVTSYRSGVARTNMRIETQATLGAIVPLGEDTSGNAHVYAEEIDGSEIHAYVKSFGSTGEPIGISQLPLGECATVPHRMVRITSDGDAIALVPSDQDVSLVRLARDRSAEEGLGRVRFGRDDRAESGSDAGDGLVVHLAGYLGRLFGPAEARAAWTNMDAYNRGREYLDNSWWCSKANYYPDGVNIRPRYLTSYNRWWYSVPYCWGGWHLKSQFNILMNSGYDAGDINTLTAGKQPGTVGVDCSGLVSRLWGLGHKRSTSTEWYYGLGGSDISYYLGLPGCGRERLGDIYLKPYSHVMMVSYVTIGGARVFESTKSDAYDRVVHVIRAWSAMSGYQVRRYINW